MLILKPSLTLARRHLRALPRLPTVHRETRPLFKANRSSSSQAVHSSRRLRRLVIATARFRQRARAGESSAALARASSASHPSPGIDTIDHGPLRPHGHRQVGDAEGAARRHPAAGGHPACSTRAASSPTSPPSARGRSPTSSSPRERNTSTCVSRIDPPPAAGPHGARRGVARAFPATTIRRPPFSSSAKPNKQTRVLTPCPVRPVFTGALCADVIQHHAHAD